MCLKCNDTGFIALKDKNGIVSKYAVKVYCGCHQDEPEHHRPLSPEDFDFPMSYAFYRGLCDEHGWNDRGPLEVTKQVSTTIPVIEPAWTKDQWQYIQQLRAQVNHLNAKVAEMRTEKKRSKGDY